MKFRADGSLATKDTLFSVEYGGPELMQTATFGKDGKMLASQKTLFKDSDKSVLKDFDDSQRVASIEKTFSTDGKVRTIDISYQSGQSGEKLTESKAYRNDGSLKSETVLFSVNHTGPELTETREFMRDGQTLASLQIYYKDDDRSKLENYEYAQRVASIKKVFTEDGSYSEDITYRDEQPNDETIDIALKEHRKYYVNGEIASSNIMFKKHEGNRYNPTEISNYSATGTLETTTSTYGDGSQTIDSYDATGNVVFRTRLLPNGITSKYRIENGKEVPLNRSRQDEAVG